MRKNFQGDSRRTRLPWVGIEHWKLGIFHVGTVLWSFETPTGRCYAMESLNPDRSNRFIIGHLAGIERAINESGAGELQRGDEIRIECVEEGGKPEFTVYITRGEK